MIEVDLYQRIRHLYTVQGRSQRQIARELAISRTTVQKYCQGGAFPEPQPRKHTRGVMTDEVQEWSQGYLNEDKEGSSLRGAVPSALLLDLTSEAPSRKTAAYVRRAATYSPLACKNACALLKALKKRGLPANESGLTGPVVINEYWRLRASKAE